MALKGLTWTPLVLRFDGSLETKQDARAVSPPDFTLLRDAHFEETSALQTRLPFGAVMGAGAIFGGGTLANCRKLATVNGELCVFTDTAFYSWNAQLSQWVMRGTHLAVSTDHAQRFSSGGDQFQCDRAELNGTIVYTWFESSGILGGNVFVAAVDKVTGSVLMAPTIVAVTGVGFSSRVVALATKILLFVQDGGGGGHNLTVRAIDPASPATGVAAAATAILTLTAGQSYDVIRQPGADTAVGVSMLNPATSYAAFTVTAALAVATSTKARTADGVVAIAPRPTTGAQIHIFRSVTATTAILGDVLTTSTLADVATAQPIGTFTSNINHLTACYRSVQTSGHFVCAVFWTAREFSVALPETKINTVDDAGTIGTQAVFNPGVAVASRAFDYNGTVFINTIFAADNQGASFSGPSLQNTYFLYREDGTGFGKMLPGVAGGFENTALSPGVASAGGTSFAWAASIRRVLVVSASGSTGLPTIGGNAYAARTIADVRITFDTNDARRTAQLGLTSYISGAEILTYDGFRIVECGFNVFGYSLAPVDGGAATGSLVAGTYACKGTYSYVNARGEFERSTTAAINTVVIAAATSSISYPSASGPLCTTRKISPNVPAFEIWRTAVNPATDVPFYLTTSQDPNASTNPNRHLPSSSAIPAFVDAFADATLITKEGNPENLSVLESLAPPAASIIIATETRLCITGIAGDPDAWFYSRERGDGEIASFHDSLRVEVPPVGGAITALWADDQFVYVARATAIYAYAGPGTGNDGSGQNYTLVRTISRDVGVVSQEAHAPAGSLGRLIKSAKGWYLLGAGGDLRYVGGAVASFDSDTVLAVHTITARHQVRILTSARMLIWDYRGLIATAKQDAGRWSECTVADGLDACLYGGTYTYLTATGPKQESATYTGLTYGLDAASSWIKPADLFGAVAVRKIQPLGEYRSAFLLRLRIYYDLDDATVVDDVVWNPSPTVVGGPLQLAHGPKRRNCQAFKVRLTAVAAGVQATLATATGLSHVVSTSGTNWAATFAAKTGNYTVIGELGNTVTMSIAFASGAPNVIDVRDHYAYDASSGLWSPDLNNVGVRVVCAAGSLTVAALEAAIVAATNLVQVSAADATPAKTISASGMAGISVTGSFTGGTFTAPTGEALKLTGLGLEVGVASPFLNRRIPSAQKA